MGFVIRAEGLSDKRVWVSVRLSDGSRSLSARHIAAVFASPTEAQAAIEDLPKPFQAAIITFSIEPDTN
jgi:hypothetical protein